MPANGAVATLAEATDTPRGLDAGPAGRDAEKNSALQVRYHRVKRHRGHKKAVVAAGHQMLEIAYYVMRDGVSYRELRADYLDRRHTKRAARRHVRQLAALGFQVTITNPA